MVISMRIAYLILCHAHPEQLGRLCQQLHHRDAHIYIHVDSNTADQTVQAMQANVPSGAQFIHRQACRWGGFSLVSASLELIKAALKDGCDYLVLLSAQDFPLKTHEQIVAKLSGHAGFIEFRRQPDPHFDIRYRYQSYHPERLNGRLAGKLLQKILRPLNRLGLFKRPIPAPLKAIYSGSQWWCLSANACQTLLDYCEIYPELIRFFRHTLVPDEMFVQSVLMHTPLADVLINDSLHYLEWKTGAWSPRVFEISDLPRLQTSPALFARKFSANGELSEQLKQYLSPI
jgi:hypothetical protein